MPYLAGSGCGTAYGVTVTTSSITTSSDSWVMWNSLYYDTATVTTTSNSSDVWILWNGPYSSATVTAIPLIVQAPETDQQRLWRAQVRQEEEKLSKKTAAAQNRAKRLLMNFLTEEQKAQYEKDRYFELLTTRDGKVRRYRLEHGWAGNVFLIDDRGKKVEKFCIHPDKRVPEADNLLAQKLLLESDEGKFLTIANRTRLSA